MWLNFMLTFHWFYLFFIFFYFFYDNNKIIYYLIISRFFCKNSQKRITIR